jgi:hypothetical protein
VVNQHGFLKQKVFRNGCREDRHPCRGNLPAGAFAGKRAFCRRVAENAEIFYEFDRASPSSRWISPFFSLRTLRLCGEWFPHIRIKLSRKHENAMC